MGTGDHNINLPEGESFSPSAERVAELGSMMRPGVFHLGPPGTDRAAWDRIAGGPVGQRILADARDAAAQRPLPQITDEIYLTCLSDGSPAPFNAVAPDTRSRMAMLPVAECLEPTGQYLDQIEADIHRTLDLQSWTHPNNDIGRETFEGSTIFNDLSSTHTASLLVATDYLLGDRLQPATREGIRREVKRRTLDPFRQRIESGKDVYWWVTVTHNWNSVCLLHTVACALALLEDPVDRAWYAATADALITYSDEGFTESGFYTEGVGYWAYGFGCYVTLSEIVRAATDGAIDWFSKPLVERMARFGQRMEIQQGVFPSFADCQRQLVLPAWLVHWQNNRIDPARDHRSTTVPIDNLTGRPFRSTLTALLVLFHQVDVDAAYEVAHEGGLRDWWEDVQFLICRPRPDADVRLASTLKGGDNSVNHNHNDLGSFTVLIGDQELLTDPGAEVYTERTFSPRRYEGDLLNSFGHPVPVVDGQLQPPEKDLYTRGVGEDVFSRVLETSFTDEEDRVILDLREAYRVPALDRLTRTFSHRRTGSGTVEVVDDVRFTAPSDFETALITYAPWSLQPDGSLRIGDDGGALIVTVSSDAGELVFHHCVIEESSTPVRLSWHLPAPVTSARILIRATPAV
ncbi:MAG: hypothetical protein HN712_01175 [Gemmatimonadetes bacterium]|jgi:hypothetical protein|nr:hypothetical protein [Gemmatimonadota bacterium]MBT6147136.1 hypothetical protein [Gemmatimonadota bacterium]MBT7858883.1 hypothetical protein [Gemmatimonadota bacterium]